MPKKIYSEQKSNILDKDQDCAGPYWKPRQKEKSVTLYTCV